ncbi:N-acetylmuramic acid 6-phosphate etherase [Atopococcus tabaci]|uniref:N-acetylmuramic acid 6-phosphate etherase n=1 Tax=Atopococcus tabaci TaxID=269774 RepID=UPI0024099687|nr:N-acetylmuramic acid 6-phosphate etherase [Atopococcus tabaci]
MEKLNHLSTETRNKVTMELDTLSIEEILQAMNEEDQKVAPAVKEALPEIADAVNAIVESFQQGGRLIYMGAGTSGRLGVLDAAECVPTFSVSPDMVRGLIAGGQKAMIDAVEGAEDSKELAKEDLRALSLNEKDTVVGIAASGRTPYAIGGLEYAKETGATAVSLSCNKNAKMSQYADIAIEVDAGPEVLTGSTRLKAGTVQKLVLNMLSTASMVRIGKVYQNLMVDVQPSNIKLEERAKNILMEATGCTYEEAAEYFEKADHHVKTAIVMYLTDVDKETAETRLEEADGFVREAIKQS